MSKSALIDAVWPDAAITDNSLAQCLIEIRRALADDAQRIIRTVKGRGFVFSAAVTTPVMELACPVGEVETPADAGPGRPSTTVPTRWRRFLLGAVCVSVAIASGLFLILHTKRTDVGPKYTQITDFTDSAVAPALSAELFSASLLY